MCRRQHLQRLPVRAPPQIRHGSILSKLMGVYSILTEIPGNSRHLPARAQNQLLIPVPSRSCQSAFRAREFIVQVGPRASLAKNQLPVRAPLCPSTSSPGLPVRAKKSSSLFECLSESPAPAICPSARSAPCSSASLRNASRKISPIFDHGVFCPSTSPSERIHCTLTQETALRQKVEIASQRANKSSRCCNLLHSLLAPTYSDSIKHPAHDGETKVEMWVGGLGENVNLGTHHNTRPALWCARNVFKRSTLSLEP